MSLDHSLMEPVMEEEASVASASGAHVTPLLRSQTIQRKTSTGNLSAASHGGLKRSRSRQFSRSSTDTGPLDRSFLASIDEKREQDNQNDEASHWHTFSLLFVALPAIAGLFFENGGAIMTDILLLALGCLFLYWSVKWPWEWYHSSQGRVLLDFDPEYLEDEDIAILEAHAGLDTDGDEIASDAGSITPTAASHMRRTAINASRHKQQKQKNDASNSLKQHELLALLSCFAMPIGVAYLLHAIRPYLSRPSGGLVSNSNLTLFVLAAEVRPFLHVFKLINRRSLHLQKVVAAASIETPSPLNLDLESITHRLRALETKLPELIPLPVPKGKEKEEVVKHTALETQAMITSATQSLQPQLDALNRAVRRYEKRATMQSMLLDSRLRDIDNRVNDALSLAAAASRMAGRPGLLSWIGDNIVAFVNKAIASILSLILLPFRTCQRAYVFLVGGKTQKKKIKKIDGERVKKVM